MSAWPTCPNDGADLVEVQDIGPDRHLWMECDFCGWRSDTLIQPRMFVYSKPGFELIWRLFGLRYPSDSISKAVYDRAWETAQRRGHHDLTVTRAIQNGKDWVILVVDASKQGWYLHGIDWWPGEPFDLDDNTFLAMAERRARQALDVIAGRQPTTTNVHYEAGMRLRRGGRLTPE